MKTIVNKRGQVIIPKILRKNLGIFSGTILEFIIKNNMSLVVKQIKKMLRILFMVALVKWIPIKALKNYVKKQKSIQTMDEFMFTVFSQIR